MHMFLKFKDMCPQIVAGMALSLFFFFFFVLFFFSALLCPPKINTCTLLLQNTSNVNVMSFKLELVGFLRKLLKCLMYVNDFC